MKKRCLSMLMAVALCLTLCTGALAASDEPAGEPETEVVEAAAAPVEGTAPESTAVEQVQALIDALPDADSITEENRVDVEARLTAIDEAKLPLGDELDALDFSRYNDAIAALNELDGMGGAEVPETLEDTLQGDGSATNPWILTQASFDNASDSEGANPQKYMTFGNLSRYSLSSGCYKLGEDITLKAYIEISASADVTLDLNGHTMQFRSTSTAFNFQVYSGKHSGTLTLNDSSANETGTISGASISVEGGCTFNLNGGTISNAKYGVKNSGTFNMTGGSITNCTTSIVNTFGTVTLPEGITLGNNVLNQGLFPFIGRTFTGTVQHSTTDYPIDGGTFEGIVENGGVGFTDGFFYSGVITGGVFRNEVHNNTNNYENVDYRSTIDGGVFYGEVKNDGVITGGVFLGSLTGDGTIEGTQHRITVDLGEGSILSGVVVGDTLYPLGEPPVTRAGFIFNGWYKDAEFTEPWDFANPNPVEDNMGFYAKWVCAGGHTGGTATCQAKAECETCGEEYGDVNAANHTALVHIEEKAATMEAEGNIEYWHCEGCGKYFSDKNGKTEIALADTVTAKLKPTAAPAPAKAVKTGDAANLALWLALATASALALGYVCLRKKEN